MARCAVTLLTLVLLTVALPLLAWPGTTAAEQEQNRLKLQQLRKDEKQKGYLAHLYHQAQSFLALSPARRDVLRKLDEELHQLPLAQRKHLEKVMKHYVGWLQLLPADQRQQIETTPDRDAKLDLIKKLREEQWIKTLPKFNRDQLADLQGPPRKALIADLKKQQWKSRVEWELASRHFDALWLTKAPKKKPTQVPESLEELFPDAQKYAREYLQYQVRPEQWQELEKAQGHWPWFPYLLVKLADDNPLALPSPNQWPKKIADLPADLANRLNLKMDKQTSKALEALEEKWPAFAAKVAELMDRKKPILRFDLWPAKFEHLSPNVRHFVENELRPLLVVKEDKDLLEKAEGRWPEYPEAIQTLARKFYLEVPWQTLPAPAGKLPANPPFIQLWDGYRLP
jgi:hypothetical protein